MKIAINACYGSFGLSEKALALLKQRGLDKVDRWGNNVSRDDPRLISVIEELGHEASRVGENVVIIEIPDGVTDWYIQDYDGYETVSEGRVWRYEDNEDEEV